MSSIKYWLSYSRRWLGTASSFFLFGLGGVLIPLIGVPVIYLLPGNRACRQARGKRMIQLSFRSFIGYMRLTGVLSYEVEQVERLKQARLVLANHPTLIDVIFLISLIPNANCVVKGRLISNPFTRGPIGAAGYIINDEGSEEIIEAAARAFDRQEALVVFPEGTRTTPGKPLKFKRGAANIALRTATDITPVVIDCSPLSLTKGNPWYRIPPGAMHFQIRVDENIQVDRYLDSKPSLAARNLTRDLNEYFTNRVKAI